MLNLDHLLTDAGADARRALIDATGFDPFDSPRFIETTICRFVGAVQTGYADGHDAVMPGGLRVEVKTSKRVSGARPHLDRFVFGCLQGVNGNGKDADAYVLAGIDGEFIRCWVLTAADVDGRGEIAIRSAPYRYRRADTWGRFEVSVHDLPRALSRLRP